jgi:UDP-N-acetylmuramate dehydrogenase
LSEPQIRELSKISPGARLGEPMSEYTHFRIGGPADVLITPASISELRNLVLFAKSEDLPLTVIGDGANLLVSDAGIRGLTLRLRGTMDGVKIRDKYIDAGCGASLTKLVRRAVNNGLAGLEFATGIPGTLGGAVAMNAGTHLGDIGSVIETITVMDRDGVIKKAEAKNASFGYRFCGLAAGGGIILGASISLKKGDGSILKAKMAELLARRKNTQPVNLPCAGCIFKNPSPETPAGELIDSLSLKGASVGGAKVSEVHANFIVNVGRASASDVLELIGLIKSRAKAEAGIDLELEVKVIGD